MSGREWSPKRRRSAGTFVDQREKQSGPRSGSGTAPVDPEERLQKHLTPLERRVDEILKRGEADE